jgi:hypothetical protein
MQIFCSIVTLIFINGSCLLISFNMDSVLEQSIEDETAEIQEILPATDYSTTFDLTDLLDLDIFDFDVDKLADKNKDDEYVFTTLDRWLSR